jgi:peptidoglycan/LPS O-acetylase OafA/YrhL
LSNKWLNAFSAVDNLKSIVSVERSSGEIPCVDGIRVFHATMVLLAHKEMDVNFNPFMNRVEMNKIGGGLLSVATRSSWLYTEAFLLLSGLLVSYATIGKLQRGRKVNIFKEISGRYLRIMPPMAALIIFATFILPKLGSGPQWNIIITFQADLCKKNCWRNFLLIHNWFGFENICMTHLHHVGTDFTLFIVGIFLVILMFKHERLGTFAIFTLATLASVRNFFMAIDTQINMYMLNGIE